MKSEQFIEEEHSFLTQITISFLTIEREDENQTIPYILGVHL